MLKGASVPGKIRLLLMRDCFPSVGTKVDSLLWSAGERRCCWLPMRIIFSSTLGSIREFPGGANGKEPACHCRRRKRRGFDPWVWKIPWRRAWQLTPVFLPGESHGQRGLAGYSPWGRKESDRTERLSLSLPPMCVCTSLSQVGF